MVVTIEDVESLDSKGWAALEDTKKEQLLQDARRETDTIYSGRNARVPTLDGDRDTFIKNLAAHKFELAEGGEVQSESQTGGNSSYNQGAPEEYLELTRYGKTALRHVRDEQSIGIVRSW